MKTVVCENGDRLYVVNLVITEKERQELAMSLFDLKFPHYSNYLAHGRRPLAAKDDHILDELYFEILTSNEVTQIKSRINYESRKEKI